jgi:3-phosphoshikimate 1-carboxyvinyltransferase
MPGDKSISHRALILSALARGKSRVTNILLSADVQSTASVLRAMGADVPALSDDFVVTGKEARLLASPRHPLDCGNSGTTARLMSGVIAGAGLTATLTGDASLSRRPMRRVAEPLRAMGASVSVAPDGGLPMTIEGRSLRTVIWESEIASAQVKSAILLAGLLGGVRTWIREPHLSRDHTERMLAARGIHMRLQEGGRSIELDEGQTLRPGDVDVPADPSSAAFFVALAMLATEGELRLTDVCLNPTRTGFFDTLRRMGGDIAYEDEHERAGEPIGTIVARPSSLRGVAVDHEEVPAMIDELPLLACVATRASGTTTVRGASELRVKESDRITTLVGNLQRIGARAQELEDGFRVVGSAGPLRGRIATHGDHRIAMSFGILNAVAGNLVEVDDMDCVAVSYPGFWRDLDRVAV